MNENIQITSLKLTIEVTRDDILEGCVREATNCPIARAGNRVLEEIFGKDKLYLSASPHSLTIYDENEIASHYTPIVPEVAKEFMHDFDSHQEVAPFEFNAEFVEM